jgi:hypothetical protein
MTSATPAGAVRAARALVTDADGCRAAAELINNETELSDLLETLHEIVAEAGDLIETRSPELVAHARALIRRSGGSAAPED